MKTNGSGAVTSAEADFAETDRLPQKVREYIANAPIALAAAHARRLMFRGYDADEIVMTLDQMLRGYMQGDTVSYWGRDHPQADAKGEYQLKPKEGKRRYVQPRYRR